VSPIAGAVRQRPAARAAALRLGVRAVTARSKCGPRSPRTLTCCCGFLKLTSRIIVGLAPGGTSDISARLVGQWLSERLGCEFITENRTGAAGSIAAEYVVNAAPDGYTLLVFASAAAINATLFTNLNFNFKRDIAPVASILRVPNVILVNPSFPVKTVPELIAYAKANPGRINMATAGIGTTPHVFGELFKMMAGVNLLPVHYRGGGPALTDLLAGQVQVMFDPAGEAMGYIKAGRLRGLAVTSATRLAALPDIPTVGATIQTTRVCQRSWPIHQAFGLSEPNGGSTASGLMTESS
jgi:tripartite-type tricarboxylate transporter receptor subunit TctC